MNFIKNIKDKVFNIYSFFKKNNKSEILFNNSFDYINKNCLNDGYNCTFVELNNNSGLELLSNGILITFLPRTNIETEKYQKFIVELINESMNTNNMLGKNKIIIKIGLNSEFIFTTYNYNILGKLRYYIENLDKTYNLIVVTNEDL